MRKPPLVLSIEQQQRLVGLVYHIARRYCRETDARFDNLVSAGLVGLTKGIESWDPERGSLGNHVAYSIRGYMVNEIRKDLRSRPPGRSLSIESFREEYGDDAIADEDWDDFGEAGDVTRYFQCLTKVQRCVFELHYLRGLNFTQIGRRLRCTHQAVQQDHANGIRRIRERLTDSSCWPFGPDGYIQ